MIDDILYCLRYWRVVHLLGITALRSRYARSKFGQMWLTLTTFIHIICIAAVWSLIWKIELNDYLPYIGVGHIFFLFFSQMVNDSSGAFVADAQLYMNDKRPFMLSVFSHIYKGFIVFLHNVPVILALVFWSPAVQPDIGFGFFVGVILSGLFLFFAVYVVATLCARFRDLIQLVALFFQLIFLLTPVMWKVEFLPQEYRDYIFLNPFASMVELSRNPILGIPVSDMAIVSMACWVGFMALLSMLVYSSLNRKVIYWV